MRGMDRRAGPPRAATASVLASLIALAVVASPLFPRLARVEAQGDRLVFAGSGMSLPITRLLAEAFGRAHPGFRIEFPSSLGSRGGIRAVAEGAITVALVSRPLTEAEQGLGLTVLPYARTALIVGTHLAVTDDNITFDDLVSVYRGTKTRWRDGREIVVLTRQADESSIELLVRTVPGFGDAYADSVRAKRWTILFTDQSMNSMLSRTPHAIGLTDAGVLTVERLPIKALKVNGVPPTPENVASGAYPLVKTLAYAFRSDRLPAVARAFLDFTRSRAAHKVLAANGYLPAD